ncbi:MAG: terminase family protein, partial [Candidatus Methylacidiphilales bacterium]
MINGANKTALIKFRAYQRGVFWNRTSRVVVLHWSRQIGKSFTLAAWAVDRLLTRPGRLVTVLSNSRDNGMEFIRKAAEVCEQMGEVMRKQGAVTSKIMDFTSEEIARRTEEANRLGDTDFIGRPDLEYECMRMEIRITVGGKEGRIKVLAANPRTARGFSGDLILDEFAFHQDSWAIWEAAEPILSSNQDFLCRIASTGNGKHNAFFKFCTNGEFEVSRVTRTDAYKLGCKIYDFKTGKEITPEEARARSADKAAYDQNYECAFRNEASALLTLELITRAERDGE